MCIRDREYCGDVINFKSYSKSYKMKRRIENPEENRAIFINVHEPIIDRATWEKVQSLHTTVSYTHLDVYKRQIIDSSPFAFRDKALFFR